MIWLDPGTKSVLGGHRDCECLEACETVAYSNAFFRGRGLNTSFGGLLKAAAVKSAASDPTPCS